MSTPASHKWEEIADIPPDAESLRDRELEALYRVWASDRDSLNPKSIRDFNAQLAREWSIETGIIENVYTLDRGITQTLIERGIDSAYIPHDATDHDPELVARIIRAHGEVLDGLFAFVKGERPLTPGYIKELHAALLRYQKTVVVFDQFGQPFETELLKGVYKTLPNNPSRADGATHEYAPPEHVASEMDRLIDFYHQHSSRNIPPHIRAAWMHHAFTQIHPFQDGNGRVARAIATAILIKDGYFPLVVSRDDRTDYIGALEAADSGDLSTLFGQFAQIQKRLLTRALTRTIETKPFALEDPKDSSSVEQAIRETRDMLVNLGRIIPPAHLAAKELSGSLARSTDQRFKQVKDRLAEDIAGVQSEFEFENGRLGSAPIMELDFIAGRLHYEPNARDFHISSFLALSSKASGGNRIVVSFSSLGPSFRGLIAAVTFFQIDQTQAPIPLCDDIFRIIYNERLEDIVERYPAWLEQSIIRGLAEWRKTLL